MPKVEMDLETTLPPERVRAALIDFTPRRPDIWPGISPRHYEVYNVGETSAEIREGTGGLWAREHYDWSDPQTVRWTVKESNFSAPGSYVAATITPRADGGSSVHIEWNRTPTTFPARLITLVIRISNGRPVANSFKRALTKMERESAAPPSSSVPASG
jgi:hypothetical protein